MYLKITTFKPILPFENKSVHLYISKLVLCTNVSLKIELYVYAYIFKSFWIYKSWLIDNNIVRKINQVLDSQKQFCRVSTFNLVYIFIQLFKNVYTYNLNDFG